MDRLIDKLGPILGGALLIAVGATVMAKPQFNMTRFGGYRVDFTGYEVPVGLGIIALGVLLVAFFSWRLRQSSQRRPR